MSTYTIQRIQLFGKVVFQVWENRPVQYWIDFFLVNEFSSCVDAAKFVKSLTNDTIPV